MGNLPLDDPYEKTFIAIMSFHIIKIVGDRIQRFKKESVYAAPVAYFTEQNANVAQTTISQAYVGEPSCLKTETRIKRKASSGGEKVPVKKSNPYQCKMCNISFSTGNALGGHMSYHGKVKKLEAQKFTPELNQPHDSELAFASALASDSQGFVDRSMNNLRW